MTKSEQDVVRRIVREEIAAALGMVCDESYQQYTQIPGPVDGKGDARTLGMIHTVISSVTRVVAGTMSMKESTGGE